MQLNREIPFESISKSRKTVVATDGHTVHATCVFE